MLEKELEGRREGKERASQVVLSSRPELMYQLPLPSCILCLCTLHVYVGLSLLVYLSVCLSVRLFSLNIVLASHSIVSSAHRRRATRHIHFEAFNRSTEE